MGPIPSTSKVTAPILFTDAACDFIRRHRGRPFLAYVPFNAAHVPNPKNKVPGAPTVWQAPGGVL